MIISVRKKKKTSEMILKGKPIPLGNQEIG